MAATFERSVQEDINHLQSQLGRNKTCRQRNDVGIVVLASQLCNLLVPAKRAAHIGVFVYSHLHSVARATNDDTPLEFAFVDNRTHLMGKVWIINAIGRIGAKILSINIFWSQKFFDFLFQSIAGVVGGNRYYFFNKNQIKLILRMQNYNKKAVYHRQKIKRYQYLSPIKRNILAINSLKGYKQIIV